MKDLFDAAVEAAVSKRLGNLGFMEPDADAATEDPSAAFIGAMKSSSSGASTSVFGKALPVEVGANGTSHGHRGSGNYVPKRGKNGQRRGRGTR